MPEGPVTPDSAADEIRDYLELLNDVAEARGRLSKLGQACEEFSTHYRALGICVLSAEADVDGFFGYLVQSAVTRRHYLQGVAKEGGGEPHRRRASFWDPVFDAIAARQWKLAKELFDGASHTWLKGEEYEDDYCYAEFLRCLVTASGDGVEGPLTRWEEVIDGKRDLRLEVAHALRDENAEAFSDALRDLLVDAESRAKKAVDKGSLEAEDFPFFPNRWVSVEGLALLAIAERLGLEPSGEFPACPPLARENRIKGFSSHGYPHVSYPVETS